ncbi:MAG TPA: NAD(P)-dependent oxidoreductase [Desulfomonilaceae bacterium]|nr:NAD(P)-dependent oxidoreductase [Desulfomonilaceae bacterium]
MARVLVTGGSGFIGTNLIESFLNDDFQILNFDLAPPQNPEQNSFFCKGDIRNAAALRGAVQEFRPELIVHLAARTDLEGNSLADYDANTIGVQNVIDVIQSVDAATRAVFASSRYVHRTEVCPLRDDEYSPFTFYGESKVRTEQIVRTSELHIPWVIVRPTSIWGPWFRIPYRMFFDTVRKGLYVHPKGRRISKSYGYVGNVVYQIRQFLSVDSRRVDKRTFYVSDDKSMDLLEFANLIQEAFGARPVRQVPMFLLRALAHAGDVLKGIGVSNPPITSFRLNNLVTPMNYDMSATCDAVGPAPYTLRQGVRATVDWILQHG